jgi:hypothetical protein
VSFDVVNELVHLTLTLPVTHTRDHDSEQNDGRQLGQSCTGIEQQQARQLADEAAAPEAASEQAEQKSPCDTSREKKGATGEEAEAQELVLEKARGAVKMAGQVTIDVWSYCTLLSCFRCYDYTEAYATFTPTHLHSCTSTATVLHFAALYCATLHCTIPHYTCILCCAVL